MNHTPIFLKINNLFVQVNRRIRRLLAKRNLKLSKLISITSILFGGLSVQAQINVSTLTPSQGGKFIDGFDRNGLGVSLTQIGDFNGDDIDDFVVVAAKSKPTSGYKQSAAYIIFGGTDLSTAYSIDTLGTNAVKVYYGLGVSADIFEANKIGDVNNDGFDDVLFHLNKRTAAILYGTDQARVGNELNITDMVSTDGFYIQSSENIMSFGSTEDMNGDDIPEMLFGTEKTAYVRYGNEKNPDTLKLKDNTGGVNISVNWRTYEWIDGINGVGDVNNDGYADVGINKFPGDWSASDTMYVVYGGNDLPSTISYQEIKGDVGFKIYGLTDGQSSSAPATNAVFTTVGDFNGDGIDDFTIGKDSYYEYNERVHTIFGQDEDFDDAYVLNNVTCTSGVDIGLFDAGDASPIELGEVGDFNGDGFDDLVLTKNNFGVVVVFGNDCSHENQMINRDNLEAEDGLHIDGINFGYYSDDRISMIDFNDDGLDDVLMGAGDAVYIIYGVASDKPTCDASVICNDKVVEKDTIDSSKDEEVTNLSNEERRNSITVFPNPIISVLQLDGVEVNQLIEIRDVFGQQVYQGKYTGEPIALDALNAGVYIIEIDEWKSKFVKE
jgi:hypothetical protein